MDTCKIIFGTLWHILASGGAAEGQFTLNVQEPTKCYRPNVRKVTLGSHAFHHLVNNNFQDTKPHILRPLAVWVALRSSGGDSPSEWLFVGPGWSRPQDFSARGST